MWWAARRAGERHAPQVSGSNLERDAASGGRWFARRARSPAQTARATPRQSWHPAREARAVAWATTCERCRRVEVRLDAVLSHELVAEGQSSWSPSGRCCGAQQLQQVAGVPRARVVGAAGRPRALLEQPAGRGLGARRTLSATQRVHCKVHLTARLRAKVKRAHPSLPRHTAAAEADAHGHIPHKWRARGLRVGDFRAADPQHHRRERPDGTAQQRVLEVDCQDRRVGPCAVAVIALVGRPPVEADTGERGSQAVDDLLLDVQLHRGDGDDARRRDYAWLGEINCNVRNECSELKQRGQRPEAARPR
eukprot:3943497-Prymnesium_polylepis.4